MWRGLMNEVNLSNNIEIYVGSVFMVKILTSSVRLSKNLSHILGNMLLLGKTGVCHNFSLLLRLCHYELFILTSS